jgi:dihydroorotase-like cyclic amidohydrolase
VTMLEAVRNAHSLGVPLPEADEYQIQFREKRQQERKARIQTWDESSFMAELERTGGHRAVELAKSTGAELYLVHVKLIPITLPRSPGLER